LRSVVVGVVGLTCTEQWGTSIDDAVRSKIKDLCKLNTDNLSRKLAELSAIKEVSPLSPSPTLKKIIIIIIIIITSITFMIPVFILVTIRVLLNEFI
jgi:hypothetical protein